MTHNTKLIMIKLLRLIQNLKFALFFDTTYNTQGGTKVKICIACSLIQDRKLEKGLELNFLCHINSENKSQTADCSWSFLPSSSSLSGTI